MKNILSIFFLIVLLFSCSSSDDNPNTQSLSGTLIENAWEFNGNYEIVEITSHGGLNYQEAYDIIITNPLSNSDGNTVITTFRSNNTGRNYSTNSSFSTTTEFTRTILNDNELWFYFPNKEPNYCLFDIANEQLIFTCESEYLYNGTLIKYRYKSYSNTQ